jgi:tripartite-type tricarboxylate transporter receptor subunit TctC
MNPTRMNAALLMISGLLMTGAAWSQQRTDYPNKPIRFVVPFVAGGPMDVIGRLVGQKLLTSMGQNVIIDNRAGAGGIIGTEVAAKSPPDGYTLLHTSSAHAMLPAFNKLPYDPVRDFSAITPATRTVGYVLGVHPSIPANSVAELLALAKKHPGRLNYGNSGYGGVLHVGMELFNAAAGVKMTTVQYKGIGQLVTDLAGGHIDLALLTSSNAVGMAQAGKIKALAISGARRWMKPASKALSFTPGSVSGSPRQPRRISSHACTAKSPKPPRHRRCWRALMNWVSSRTFCRLPISPDSYSAISKSPKSWRFSWV